MALGKPFSFLKQRALIWSITQKLMETGETTAHKIWEGAYMWCPKHMVPKDHAYVQRTDNRVRMTSSLRNQVRSSQKIYNHLLWCAKNNNGRHTVILGKRRLDVLIKRSSGIGAHDVVWKQEILGEYENVAARLSEPQWVEVTN